jgi:hypothetical protein
LIKAADFTPHPMSEIAPGIPSFYSCAFCGLVSLVSCRGLVFSGEMLVCRFMVGPPPGGNWFNWFLSFAAK